MLSDEQYIVNEVKYQILQLTISGSLRCITDMHFYKLQQLLEGTYNNMHFYKLQRLLEGTYNDI